MVEDSSMKFYFCETCGKRITEEDVEAGEARNKKLKGVFCAECAIGVLTMETLPVSQEQAQRILGKSSDTSQSATAKRGKR